MNAQRTEAANAGRQSNPPGWVGFQRGGITQEQAEQEKGADVIAQLKEARYRLDDSTDRAARLTALADATNVMNQEHREKHERSIDLLIELTHQASSELADRLVDDGNGVEKAIWALKEQQGDLPGDPLFIVADMLNAIATDAFVDERREQFLAWGNTIGRAANRNAACLNALEVWRQWLERHGMPCGVLNYGVRGLQLKPLGPLDERSASSAATASSSQPSPVTADKIKARVTELLEEAFDDLMERRAARNRATAATTRRQQRRKTR